MATEKKHILTAARLIAILEKVPKETVIAFDIHWDMTGQVIPVGDSDVKFVADALVRVGGAEANFADCPPKR
jgi:hypothetical protein